MATINDILRIGDNLGWSKLPKRGVGKIFATENGAEVRWIVITYEALAKDPVGRDEIRAALDQGEVLRRMLNATE